jgi:uncharacterized membrane protein HdeD (DUF308 family)
MEFGLVSVVLGVLVADWPETPEFIATAAGAWLLLLAGCRAFGLLAERPVDSPARTAPWPRLVAGFAAAFCVGTGYVLMHAAWPTRPAAIPTALTFGAVTIGACGVLDVMVARFGPRADARQLLVRAAGWIAAALALMALLSRSPSAAMAVAAVLIGVVELVRGAYALHRAVNRQTGTTGRVGRAGIRGTNRKAGGRPAGDPADGEQVEAGPSTGWFLPGLLDDDTAPAAAAR